MPTGTLSVDNVIVTIPPSDCIVGEPAFNVQLGSRLESIIVVSFLYAELRKSPPVWGAIMLYVEFKLFDVNSNMYFSGPSVLASADIITSAVPTPLESIVNDPV